MPSRPAQPAAPPPQPQPPRPQPVAQPQATAQPQPAPRPVAQQPSASSARPQTTATTKPAASKAKPGRFAVLKKYWWLILIALALLGATAYFTIGYLSELNKRAVQGAHTTATQQASKDLTPQELVAEIRKVIKLPDEEPEVATINNIDVLKGKDFFKDAQNGDDVIIFKKAQRGLIYRASEHMIITYEKVTFSGSLPQ